MLLEVENLHVRYGNVEALHGINLQIRQGEIVTILGANGAGRTTTLHAISGLLRPSQGEIRFESRSIHKLPAHRLVAMGVVLVPDGLQVFPELTVLDILLLCAFARGGAPHGLGHLGVDRHAGIGRHRPAHAQAPRGQAAHALGPVAPAAALG